MRQPTVLLADDHVVFTDGIVRILEDRFDVVGTVTDGGSLFEATCRLRPDVVVTDISMPRLSGLEGLRRLKAKHEDSRVIFLTMHADAKLAAEAFRLGAKGFVLKHASDHDRAITQRRRDVAYRCRTTYLPANDEAAVTRAEN